MMTVVVRDGGGGDDSGSEGWGGVDDSEGWREG